MGWSWPWSSAPAVAAEGADLEAATVVDGTVDLDALPDSPPPKPQTWGEWLDDQVPPWVKSKVTNAWLLTMWGLKYMAAANLMRDGLERMEVESDLLLYAPLAAFIGGLMLEWHHEKLLTSDPKRAAAFRDKAKLGIETAEAVGTFLLAAGISSSSERIYAEQQENGEEVQEVFKEPYPFVKQAYSVFLVTQGVGHGLNLLWAGKSRWQPQFTHLLGYGRAAPAEQEAPLALAMAEIDTPAAAGHTGAVVPHGHGSREYYENALHITNLALELHLASGIAMSALIHSKLVDWSLDITKAWYGALFYGGAAGLLGLLSKAVKPSWARNYHHIGLPFGEFAKGLGLGGDMMSLVFAFGYRYFPSQFEKEYGVLSTTTKLSDDVTDAFRTVLYTLAVFMAIHRAYMEYQDLKSEFSPGHGTAAMLKAAAPGTEVPRSDELFPRLKDEIAAYAPGSLTPRGDGGGPSSSSDEDSAGSYSPPPRSRSRTPSPDGTPAGSPDGTPTGSPGKEAPIHRPPGGLAGGSSSALAAIEGGPVDADRPDGEIEYGGERVIDDGDAGSDDEAAPPAFVGGDAVAAPEASGGWAWGALRWVVDTAHAAKTTVSTWYYGAPEEPVLRSSLMVPVATDITPDDEVGPFDGYDLLDVIPEGAPPGVGGGVFQPPAPPPEEGGYVGEYTASLL